MWYDCIILGLSPKVIGSDYPVIVSGDFGRRECGSIVSSLDICPKLYPVASVLENVVGLHHPWT